MSGAAFEKSAGGKISTSSPLRLFVDRHEHRQLPVVFFLLVVPSVQLMVWSSARAALHASENQHGKRGMGIGYLGLTAVGWRVMADDDWWDLLVAAFSLFGIVSAVIYLVIIILQHLWKRHQASKGKVLRVPPAVARHLSRLAKRQRPLGREAPSDYDPKSFGVYLGSFTNPPSPLELSLLSKWDIIVLDPNQHGVIDAIPYTSATHILGRFDISAIVGRPENPGDEAWNQALTRIDDALALRLIRAEELTSRYSAVLLANWQAYLPPIIFQELIKHFTQLNFDVFLEISEPEYLTEDECRNIGMHLIKGLICRNGTISRDGDRQDYYQMTNMRRAQRALAKHMSLGGIVFAMWETIDDDANASHSVLSRSNLWCRFNTALSWIGSETALTDAVAAAETTQDEPPLGALMWLKTNEAMEVHEIWRLNDSVTREPCPRPGVFNLLDDFVPDLKKKLALLPPVPVEQNIPDPLGIDAGFDWSASQREVDLDPLSYSAEEEDYTALGCSQIGLPATRDGFAALVEGQRKLRDLTPCMLDRLQKADFQEIGEKLRPLHELSVQFEDLADMNGAIEELLDLLAIGTGDDTDRLRIYMGIHSGFHRGTGEQYWGLYDTGADPRGGRRGSHPGFLDLFISLKSGDRAGTILHTWLSMKRFDRTRCLKAEWVLAKGTDNLDSRWKLPKRIVQDIESLTSQELILLLQRLCMSRNQDASGLAERIGKLCRHQLIEIPTRDQLRTQNTDSYLRGEISIEQLIGNRFAWYREHGCHVPDEGTSVEVFKAVNARVPRVLIAQETSLHAKIEVALRQLMRKHEIDAAADIFALSVFCAFRKLAVEEVYLEILDRNPLPNRHADQAACFAEMFATGSQCETYFDMTSNVLGRVLRDKYQAYYMQHQPVTRLDGSTELPTSYASKSIDEDPDAHRPKLPMHYQITFLGIFAVPALIDIMFLTILGRGLYLSNYMSADEKTMATAGLMTGLLLCGGIGTWIGYGGSYYLHAMSFPAMNMFVLTRFSAGLAMLSFIGSFAFVILGIVRSWYSGWIFVFYFCSLNTYLTLLATLAIYQFPGFMFQSGRTTVVACLPILLISPIVTLWVDKDIIIYPCVISGFLIALLFGTREVVAKWGSWYLDVPVLTDNEVVNFYKEVTPAQDIPKVPDLAATPLPRKAFFAALEKERKRKPWQKSAASQVIVTHVAAYDATLFLMDWYCKYSRTAMPYPYSPTWNLMVKTALDTLKDMQKGLKLHNAFIHWRFGGDEVWCGVLYFLIALMDKWVSLLTGNRVVGLSDAGSPVFRLAVGFALAYYLTAAVCLDAVAQPLWPKANKKTNQPITSLAFLKDAARNDIKARRKLYWVNFAKFFFSHLWGFSITSALMWTFGSSRPATIMYTSYVLAYTGLLWYQYNRIYCGPLAMNNLIVAAISGLIVGLCVRTYIPAFEFGSVLALGVSTWMSAILSWRTAKVGWLIFREEEEEEVPTPPLYSFNSVGSLPPFSQRTLSEIFGQIDRLPDDEKFRVRPGSPPGNETMQILRASITAPRSASTQAAFPKAEQMLNMAVGFWSHGTICVDLVSSRHLVEDQKTIRSLYKVDDGQMHLLVFCSRYIDIQQQSRIVAEAILQTVAEAKLHLSHDHSCLAETLLAEHNADGRVVVSTSIKRHIDFSASERTRILKGGDAEILRHLLLGLNCDIDWDLLPPGIRTVLLDRCGSEGCFIDDRHITWIRTSFFGERFTTIEQFLARCNLGVELAVAIKDYALARSREYNPHEDDPSDLTARYHRFKGPPIPLRRPQSLLGKLWYRGRSTYKGWRFVIKFFVIALTADSEYQRELDYFIQDKPALVRWPIRILLNGVWIYCRRLQSVVIPLFMFHRRENVALVRTNMRGIKTTMTDDKVRSEGHQGSTTGFLKAQAGDRHVFHLYSGRHETEPEDVKKLISVSTYVGKKLRLTRKEDYINHKVANVYIYTYNEDASQKLPTSRKCIEGDLAQQEISYSDIGYVDSGQYWKDGNLVHFQYYYRRHARYDDELLRARFTLAHFTIQVSWCYPSPTNPEDLDKWIPNPKVTSARYTMGADHYESYWNYDHRSHPTIHTMLHGETVPTPAMIQHDWFGILQKPRNSSFLADNPLFAFRNKRSHFIVRVFGFNTKWYPVSTAVARNHLWRTWKGTKDLDAVTVRWLDEHAMRSASVLGAYWVRRDLGLLRHARAYFQSQADAILARTDLDPEVSSWSAIAFKYGDLDSFGQGGDAHINTRSVSTQIQDTEEKLHVLAMDTGTWPNEGGGVSACRRDMVNDLSTIRWHVVAENANDFGVPKFQTERNIQSLTVLPLWGMDFLTPNHGLFRDILDSAVQRRSNHTYAQDIRRNFLPILDSLVKCARATRFGPEHVEEASRALVDLSNYFENDRHWTQTWMSKPVKQRWRELWLADSVENATPISQWWDAELPTLAHLDNALDMWHRFLFIFTLPVPERIPDIFQASHHFAGASYGVLCKLKRNCTLHVWDHCISWREVTVFLSSAMSFDAPFVCTSLIHLSRMTSTLILHYADVVLPCADFFNPGWEVEHGTQEGILQHRKTFARKIDPVVNGICNMESFVPIPKIKSSVPTVVMLSHVRFVKDIKNAILAADIIVNEWGFKHYQLDIYGDMEKAPAYSVECKEILAAKGLRDHVALKGLGSPSQVLEEAWIFLNSSVSEGLPLAMGEAALTGVPVVCTDVGASFRVVTDPVTWKKFSAVVAPNDAYSLAKAQINVLALLDEWSEYAEDEAKGPVPRLALHPSAREVEIITERMYNKEAQRRKLGMMGRANVLKSFSSHRYLREHEQMLWIGKMQSLSYLARGMLNSGGERQALVEGGSDGKERAGSGSSPRSHSPLEKRKGADRTTSVVSSGVASSANQSSSEKFGQFGGRRSLRPHEVV